MIATRMTSLNTGRPVRIDVPKFPRIILASHDRYWEYQEADSAGWLPAADAVCSLSKLLKGSPGDKYRTRKTTKLTPKSNSTAIASSLEIITVMGRMEASFIAERVLKKAGYPGRYPAING